MNHSQIDGERVHSVWDVLNPFEAAEHGAELVLDVYSSREHPMSLYWPSVHHRAHCLDDVCPVPASPKVLHFDDIVLRSTQNDSISEISEKQSNEAEAKAGEHLLDEQEE